MFAFSCLDLEYFLFTLISNLCGLGPQIEAPLFPTLCLLPILAFATVAYWFFFIATFPRRCPLDSPSQCSFFKGRLVVVRCKNHLRMHRLLWTLGKWATLWRPILDCILYGDLPSCQFTSDRILLVCMIVFCFISCSCCEIYERFYVQNVYVLRRIGCAMISIVLVLISAEN